MTCDILVLTQAPLHADNARRLFRHKPAYGTAHAPERLSQSPRKHRRTIARSEHHFLGLADCHSAPIHRGATLGWCFCMGGNSE